MTEPSEPPQRNYAGCLIPIGIATGLCGVWIFVSVWKPDRMSPSEREQEIARLVGFMMFAIAVILVGVFRRKSN